MFGGMHIARFLFLFWLISGFVFGLAPHELVLLVNEDSAASREVANHFIEQRGIPAVNVIYLEDVPDSSSVSPDDFTRLIWTPVQEILKLRGLNDRVFAWVYSAGFPYRVTSTPQVSFTGLHLANNELPEADQIERGIWRSPYFAGPDAPKGPEGGSLSIIRFASMIPTNRPPAAISLGYTGPNGNTVSEIVTSLIRSTLADGTHPGDPILIYSNSGARSSCRHWQFEPTARTLKRLGQPVEIRPGQQPKGAAAGVLTGHESLSLTPLRLAPGAICDNLTSFGAAYDIEAQTKISDWFRAGAAAASGTVVEPFAIWTKFPHARVFVHHRAGCSALESLVLSTRCPLQSYFLGDPLCAPWRQQVPLEPTWSIEDDLITIRPGELPDGYAWVVLVNGRLASTRLETSKVSFHLAKLPPGHNEFRVMAFTDSGVRHFTQAVLPVTLPGPVVQLKQGGAGQFLLEADGTPERLRLFCGLRYLGEGASVRPNSDLLGPGPVRLQAEAIYPDGRRVRSSPVRWSIPRDAGE